MRLLRPEHPAARDRAAPASPAARPLLVQSGAAMRLIAGTITGVKFLSMDQRLVSEFKTRGRRRRNPIGGYLDRRYAGTLQRGLGAGPFGRCAPLKAWIDKPQSSVYIPAPRVRRTHLAQVAELVDALVSGTSEAIRGGSSPLLGTTAGALTAARRGVSWKWSGTSLQRGAPDRARRFSRHKGLHRLAQ